MRPFTKELKRLRNIPLIVQIFAWYFVVPEFIPRCKDWMPTVEPVYAQLPTAFNKVCPEHKAPDGREKSPPELLRGDFFAFSFLAVSTGRFPFAFCKGARRRGPSGTF